MSSRFLVCARTARSSPVVSTSSRRSKGIFSSFIWPDSILDKSKMSLIRSDELKILGLRPHGQEFAGCLDEFPKIEGNILQFHMAGFDFGQIQNVVDQI